MASIRWKPWNRLNIPPTRGKAKKWRWGIALVVVGLMTLALFKACGVEGQNIYHIASFRHRKSSPAKEPVAIPTPTSTEEIATATIIPTAILPTCTPIAMPTQPAVMQACVGSSKPKPAASQQAAKKPAEKKRAQAPQSELPKKATEQATAPHRSNLEAHPVFHRHPVDFGKSFESCPAGSECGQAMAAAREAVKAAVLAAGVAGAAAIIDRGREIIIRDRPPGNPPGGNPVDPNPPPSSTGGGPVDPNPPWASGNPADPYGGGPQDPNP